MRTTRTAFPLVLTVAALAALLGGCSAGTDDQALTKEVADLRAELARAQKDQQKLSSQLAAQTRRVDGLAEDLSHVRQLAVEVKAAPTPDAQVSASDGGAPADASGMTPAAAASLLSTPQGMAIKTYLATEEGRKVIEAAIQSEREASDRERDQRQVNQRVERFAKQANLTEDQTKRMKEVMNRSADAMRELWSPFRDLPPETSPEQRDELRQQNMAKLDEVRKKTDDDMRTVLDQTQFELYQQDQDKLRANMRGPMAPRVPGMGGNGRRNGGGGAGGGGRQNDN